MKTAFQVEAFSEWSGQLLVAADYFIVPPPFYEVLHRNPARHPGHNHPAGHNHPNDRMCNNVHFCISKSKPKNVKSKAPEIE
mmetsp:Transcript_15077/g.27290  ORF Transcript_15077/g.27290 Transcript_15077/m.27290 type:complete len:82 (-) Transcript_15077:2-247(-)